MSSGKKNYFRHSNNARNDEFVVELLKKFKEKGYFMWFALIEMCNERIANGEVPPFIFHKSTLYKGLICVQSTLNQFLTFAQSRLKLDSTLVEPCYKIDIKNLNKYNGWYEKNGPNKIKRNKIKRNKIKINEIKEIHPHNFEILDQTQMIQKWNEMFPNKQFKGFYLGGGKHEENYLKSASIIKTIDEWVEIFNRVKNSSFLQSNSWSTLTWVINYDNTIEIMQGKYDNEKINTDYELDDME